VESKVKEKAGELWSKGKQIVQQMQQKHKEQTQKLVADLEKSRLKQQELEATNAQLKLTLQGLTARLTLLGQVALAKDFNLLSPDASTAPGLSTAPGEGTPPSQGTPTTKTSPSPSPAVSSSATTGCETPKLLPGIPAFPYPGAGGLQPALLSLAEALGQKTPPGRQPFSLANTVTATNMQAMPAPFTANGQAVLGLVGGGSGIFTFTLRKADATDLGLNVSHHDDDRCLRVENVRPEGAVDAWNKQCQGGPCAFKVVLPGDRIISVNTTHYDPKKMLDECKEKQLLKLTVVRGDIPLPPMPSAEGQQSPGNHELRADASVFVPTGGAIATNSSAIPDASETKE